MGCNASAVNVVHPLAPEFKSPVLPTVSRSPTEIWNAIDENLPIFKAPKVARDKHRKTVHIYVASTFADFHSVRKVRCRIGHPIRRSCFVKCSCLIRA